MSLNSLTMARVSGSFLLLSSLRWSWNEVLDRHISTWSRHCLRSAAMETRLEGLERWCVSCYQHAGGVSGAGLVRRVSLCGDKTCLSSLSGSGGDWMIPLCWYTHTRPALSVSLIKSVTRCIICTEVCEQCTRLPWVSSPSMVVQHLLDSFHCAV